MNVVGHAGLGLPKETPAFRFLLVLIEERQDVGDVLFTPSYTLEIFQLVVKKEALSRQCKIGVGPREKLIWCIDHLTLGVVADSVAPQPRRNSLAFPARGQTPAIADLNLPNRKCIGLEGRHRRVVEGALSHAGLGLPKETPTSYVQPRNTNASISCLYSPSGISWQWSNRISWILTSRTVGGALGAIEGGSSVSDLSRRCMSTTCAYIPARHSSLLVV